MSWGNSLRAAWRRFFAIRPPYHMPNWRLRAGLNRKLTIEQAWAIDNQEAVRRARKWFAGYPQRDCY